MKVLYFDKLSRDVARGVVWGFKPPPRNFFEAASKRGLVFLPAKLLPSDNPWTPPKKLSGYGPEAKNTDIK